MGGWMGGVRCRGGYRWRGTSLLHANSKNGRGYALQPLIRATSSLHRQLVSLRSALTGEVWVSLRLEGGARSAGTVGAGTTGVSGWTAGYKEAMLGLAAHISAASRYVCLAPC